MRRAGRPFLARFVLALVLLLALVPVASIAWAEPAAATSGTAVFDDYGHVGDDDAGRGPASGARHDHGGHVHEKLGTPPEYLLAPPAGGAGHASPTTRWSRGVDLHPSPEPPKVSVAA
ncbi:hypothetical protein [Aureimonas psammosilenae]|uniref:hypothetical protein n=1 Tax=Aureimonas psammosilenae TaxID=2495496 RepID=UPI0012613926|nr:hypothetical protein [Aureimonas psammosilenae]